MKKTMFVILFEAAALAAVASHGAWNELLPVPKRLVGRSTYCSTVSSSMASGPHAMVPITPTDVVSGA